MSGIYRTRLIGDSGPIDSIPANGYVGMVAVAPGHVSTDNSTKVALGSGGIFTGNWEEITNFGVIVITVKANVASATDGLMVEFSCDGTDIISNDKYTIPANTGKTFSFQAAAKYFRVKYTNGGSAQSSFDLQTLLKPYYVKPSSHRIADAIISDDDAELVKAVLTGKNAAGDFVNFQATTAGNFKISLEELENGISTNSNKQLNVTVYDSAGNAAEVDDTTGSFQIIDYEHHEIHGGSHFYVSGYETEASAGTITFVVTTPNTAKWAHMTFSIAGTAQTVLNIYEGASGITGGTPTTPINNNRNSTATSDLTIVKDPTAITSDGTLILSQSVGVSRSANVITRNQEIILKQNTIYVFRIVSGDNNNIISYLAEWYEHTNR